MLVVALHLSLGREVLHLGSYEATEPAQEAFDPLLFLLVHLQHPFCQEGCRIVDNVRFFLFGDEVACCVFGQAEACGKCC